MELTLIAIKDNGAQFFQPIQCVRSIGEAKRGFMDIINDPKQGQLHAHPEDFDLYKVGTYDDQTGTIKIPEQPELLDRGINVKRT